MKQFLRKGKQLKIIIREFLIGLHHRL